MGFLCGLSSAFEPPTADAKHMQVGSSVEASKERKARSIFLSCEPEEAKPISLPVYHIKRPSKDGFLVLQSQNSFGYSGAVYNAPYMASTDTPWILLYLAFMGAVLF